MRSILGAGIRTDQSSFGMPWEPQFWDADRWRPQMVFRRFRAWISASRRRRRTAWIVLALFVLFVFPGLVHAVSIAQTGTATQGTAPNAATSWMNVKDSYGVNVSSYMLVVDRGGVFNLGNFAMWIILMPLFAVWQLLSITGVWLPAKAMDFQWLNLLSAPLQAMARNLTAQIATPLLASTALAIGAFFVGYFIVRALYAKAAVQVVTMIAFAIGGVFFLANPLAEALSDHGVLIQGRDLGLSVAAGLNGHNNPNPSQLVGTLQATMADNFVRLPLQVWNFGHVVDTNPSCRAAWSAAMAAGSEDRVKGGMKSCGDSAAYAAVDNPGVGQIGAGLLLLLCAVILLAFAAYLSIKIMWAALDLIYYGFASIFGFAAGGYIYGPTQTFTVRCVVHGFIAAGKMAFFVIALGVYELLLGSLFRAANGQIMVVFVIGAGVEIIAIIQVRRLSRNIDEANDWVVNRIGSAIHSGGSAQGAGGGALGMGLGMGNSGAANSMSPLAMVGAISTINSSPLTAWAAGGRLNPLSPWSWLDHMDKKNKARGMKTKDLRAAAHAGVKTQVHNANAARDGIARAKRRARALGLHSSADREAAFAAQNVVHMTGLSSNIPFALQMAGVRQKDLHRAWTAATDAIKHTDKEPLQSGHIGHVVAAHGLFENELVNGHDPKMVMARFHALEAVVDRYRGDFPGGVGLPPELENLGRSYVMNPEMDFITRLQKISSGDTSDTILVHGSHIADLTPKDADRLGKWITNEHALRIQAATNWAAEDPTDLERIRVLRAEVDNGTQTIQYQQGKPSTGANSLAQPDTVARPFTQPDPVRYPLEPRIPGDYIEALRNRRHP
ncbi:hypothetical protein [Nocardia niwae]|uniref:Uncharacterized protein n=1 Tax=Nocardia niwae TaxID=626084 RepID=A0ABV2X8W3_9NOCA|nr:hypothetical protein [Nocardia niwae]